MGENTQSLIERYHRAAEMISCTFTPGKGGLMQVLQLFLMASWLKSEAYLASTESPSIEY
jgi:hypothetical protein